MLIYPRHLVAIDENVMIHNSPVAIKQLSLDLDCSTSDLQAATCELSSRVRSWTVIVRGVAFNDSR